MAYGSAVESVEWPVASIADASASAAIVAGARETANARSRGRARTIPTAMAQDFTTYQDGQSALALHVVQGERDLVADCRSLARFELRGIPPMAAGAAASRAHVQRGKPDSS